MILVGAELYLGAKSSDSFLIYPLYQATSTKLLSAQCEVGNQNSDGSIMWYPQYTRHICYKYSVR